MAVIKRADFQDSIIMTLRIIDNKRIDLTDDEYALYKSICKAYAKLPHIIGEDFFKDLFETDERGMIIFLRPPQTKFSIEVYLFLVNIMIHQQLGISSKQVDDLILKTNPLLEKMQDGIKKMEKLLEAVEKM